MGVDQANKIFHRFLIYQTPILYFILQMGYLIVKSSNKLNRLYNCFTGEIKYKLAFNKNAGQI